MSCNSNKNLGGLKSILDFNVTYTGCTTVCGGLEIKAGDTLRNVLDALVANCDGDGPGPGEASTNFWFSVEAPTFTEDVKNGDFALTGEGEIYQFTAGSWVDTGIQIGGGTGGGGSWGEITGDITDQTDLTDYINLLISEAPVNPDNIGFNLHLDSEGKIGAGVIEGGLFLTSSGVFPPEAEDAYIAVSGTDVNLTSGEDGTLNISSNGGNFRAETNGGNMTLATLSGLFSVTGEGNKIISSGPENSRSSVSLNGTNAELHQLSLIGQDNRASFGILSSGSSVGIRLEARKRDISSQDSHYFNVTGPNQTAPTIDYALGMPDDANGNSLVTKDYTDDLVSALEATVTAQAALIADLTSRIEALEG